MWLIHSYRKAQYIIRPPGVHIWDSSKGYFGKTPKQFPVSWKSAPFVSHTVNPTDYAPSVSGTISAQLEGYAKQEHSYVLEPNEEENVFFYMRKASRVLREKDSSVSVSFMNNPSGVVITGDGKYFGTTPFKKTLFWPSKSSRIRIIVEEPGYSSQKRVITHIDTQINFVLQASMPKAR
jgi:hypothetical protein